MERINKSILSDLLESVGSLIELIRLERVCKKWKEIIKNLTHKFTLQGIKLHRDYHPCNVEVCPIFQKLSDYKFSSIDLRGVKIASLESLGLLLLNQPRLKILNLSSSFIDIFLLFFYMSEQKEEKKELLLEELRITNVYQNRNGYHGSGTFDTKPIYQLIPIIYPRLQKLYAGNTLANSSDFYQIISSMKNLKLLDISFSLNSNEMLESIDLQQFFSSSVEKIYFHGSDEQSREMSKRTGIQFIGKTIEDIISEVKTDDDLCILESWLESGGDIDLQPMKSFDTIQESSSFYKSGTILNQIQLTIGNDDLLVKIFQILVKYDINKSHHHYNDNLPGGLNLISTAVSQGHRMLAKYLLCQGFYLCTTYTKFCKEIPILTAAVHAENLEIIEEFVKLNIHKEDYYTPNNCNPICAAIVTDKYNILTYLMRNGVSYYPCPDHTNILITKLKYLKIILSAENFFKIKIDNLHEAAEYYIYVEKVEEATAVITFIGKIDIDKGRDIIIDKDLRGFSMHTPWLVLATEKKLFSIVELLVSYGYDVNIVDKDGRNAFMVACAYGEIEFIKLFYANGARVNNKDNSGRTGLHLAAENGHSDSVRVIIKCGGSTRLRCNQGQTPLDYAIINDRADIIRILKSCYSKCRIIRIVDSLKIV